MMESAVHERSQAPASAAVTFDRRWHRAVDAWRRFRRNRLALCGLISVVFVVVLALLASVIAPQGPFATNGPRLTPPSAGYWLGTDNLGRDILAGLVYGARISLLVGFTATLMAAAIGVTIGAISGYYGGRIDNLLTRLTEVFQVVPRFFLALLIAAIFGATIWGIIFIIGILSWPEFARLIRAEFLALKARPFVTAARAYGASDAAIIWVEIMPNAVPPVIVSGALQVSSAVLLEASLSFLGVGDPSVMSWGTMLNAAQQYLQEAWWAATFPGLAICFLTLGVALMADGLNDALNPRLKEVAEP
jgi:peptide/nickel transport system permease protein